MACAALIGVVACAEQPQTPSVAAGPIRQPLAAPNAPLASAASPGAASASAKLPSEPVEAARPATLAVPLERVLTIPVSSIALGEGARVAALADEPYVADARGLRVLPLPAALRPKSGERDELRIFFGRDNEPRIMGTRWSSSRESSIYWRYTAGVWRDGREEIGRLGDTSQGGLWGVLGAADPELVCRANAQCIIKRTSGWTTVPAGSAPRVVELLNGVLWGLDESGLANIDAKGWSPRILAPKWSAPQAFWASVSEAWVASAHAFFHYRAQAWVEEPAPVFEPTAFWGARADSLWIVGKGGVAHFDGQAWRALTLAGPLSAVAGRGEHELWLAGEAGLFRASP